MTRKNNMTSLYCPVCNSRMHRAWTKKSSADGVISHAYKCKLNHKWRVINREIVEQIGGVDEVNGVPVISRAEAMKKGLKRYFVGKPCRTYGHISEREVGCGGCVECKNLRKKVARKTKKPECALDDCDSDEIDYINTQHDKEFEELQKRYPNARRIKGYAQSGSK